MKKRRRRAGPWLTDWIKYVGKVKLLGYRLCVPTFADKTMEDRRPGKQKGGEK